jgi:hypothetical protein
MTFRTGTEILAWLITFLQRAGFIEAQHHVHGALTDRVCNGFLTQRPPGLLDSLLGLSTSADPAPLLGPMSTHCQRRDKQRILPWPCGEM